MAEERTNAAQHYASSFADLGATDVARAPIIDEMFPGMSSSAIAAALGNRISGAQVRLWRTGRRPVPLWVRELAQVKIARLSRALAQTPIGPGSRAGWNNLGAYRAAKNANNSSR